MTASDDDERIAPRDRRHDRPADGPNGGRPDVVEPVDVEGSEHLAELLETNPLVLVDFYAEWCAPCGELDPVVEDLARTTDALVAKVDVDVEQLTAARCDVTGVPTLLLFSDGEAVERLVGVRERDEVAALIETYAAV